MKFKISTVKLKTDCDHFFEKEQKRCSLYSFASLWNLHQKSLPQHFSNPHGRKSLKIRDFSLSKSLMRVRH